jgi:uncharacterized protein
VPRFDRSEPAQGPVVQGFTDRGFKVDGGLYEALLLSPTRADGWHAPSLEDLNLDALAPLLAIDPQPEFLLLGTGASMRLPPGALVADLEARGIGIEAMDSRAAARTWGLLRGEHRWIVAAIMPLDQ